MQYTVVHSKDPYLLARLATDLQMEGLTIDLPWAYTKNPFTGKNYMTVYESEFPANYDSEGDISFYEHECNGDPTRHELTSSNYIKVLTQILEV